MIYKKKIKWKVNDSLPKVFRNGMTTGLKTTK